LHDLLKAPFSVSDPGDAGAIIVDRCFGVVPLVSGAAGETRTLAVPTKSGLVLTMVMKTDGGGDIVLTVASAYDQAGSVTITFGDAGDFVTLVSVEVAAGTYAWRVMAFDGVTGPTIEFAGIDVDTLTVDTTATIADLTATSLKLAITAVAAAGSLIGEGGNLVAGLNVVSAADNTKCVDLPATVAGTVVVVSSSVVAKSLPVFPAAGSSIDNLAANTKKTIGAATATTGAIFIADNATHWVTVLGDTA
jgi:hypothetical protein